MRKRTIIIAGLAILLLLGSLYFIFGNKEASGWSSIQPGNRSPGQAPGKPPAQDTVTLQVSSMDKPKDVTFKLYKHKVPVTMEDLDRVEQKTVSFLADYFNAPAEETVRQLYTRMRKYWHPNTQDWEIEGYIKDERAYIGPEKFPINCERQLLGVYLLPEYYQAKGIYVVPVKIQYLQDSKEKEDVLLLGIVRASDGYESIGGHYENYSWYLKEVTKKYNLDGTGEAEEN